MGELTRANALRLSQRLEILKQKRKREQTVFLCVIIGICAAIGGYMYGTYKPYKNDTPKWAEKFGEAASGKKMAPRPKPSRSGD